MKRAYFFSAVISDLSKESNLLSISKSLNSFLLQSKYSIGVIWLFWTGHYNVNDWSVWFGFFSPWNNWICFYLIFRMAQILKEGTGHSRKVLGSSGYGIALTISILLKIQPGFKAWNVHFFPFHIPICSLKHLRESNRRKIKYLTQKADLSFL